MVLFLDQPASGVADSLLGSLVGVVDGLLGAFGRFAHQLLSAFLGLIATGQNQ